MVTLDVKLALVSVLLIALIVLVIYLAVVAKNAVQTIKSLNRVLSDAEKISGIAAERAVQLDGVADEVQEAVTEVARCVQGKQGTIEVLTNLFKSFSSLASAVNKKEEPKRRKRN